jgi:hypothetical protein
MPMTIQVEGLTTLLPKLQSLPLELKEEVIKAATDYSLEVLKEEEPPSKYVTRKAAYGQTFQSDKQRRWFFAALGDGRISVPYHRTGQLAKSWKVSRSENGAIFTNTSPGASFVMGSPGQSRHEKMVGWSTIGHITTYHLSFTSSKFRDVIQKAYQRVIRKLRLG